MQAARPSTVFLTTRRDRNMSGLARDELVVIIDSSNGLLPVRRQNITWTDADLWINLSELKTEQNATIFI